MWIFELLQGIINMHSKVFGIILVLLMKIERNKMRINKILIYKVDLVLFSISALWSNPVYVTLYKNHTRKGKLDVKRRKPGLVENIVFPFTWKIIN